MPKKKDANIIKPISVPETTSVVYNTRQNYNQVVTGEHPCTAERNWAGAWKRSAKG
jgi:hypothetical protein